MKYTYNDNKKLVVSFKPIKSLESKRVVLTEEQIKFCKGFDNNGNAIFDDSNLRKEVMEKKYLKISDNVQNKIINEFYSNVTGTKIKYQTSLTDQFEISQIKLSGRDFKIKCYDNEGNSIRVFHTAQQISDLYEEFFIFVADVKMKGDIKKSHLKNNYLQINLEDLQNYNTDI